MQVLRTDAVTAGAGPVAADASDRSMHPALSAFWVGGNLEGYGDRYRPDLRRLREHLPQIRVTR